MTLPRSIRFVSLLSLISFTLVVIFVSHVFHGASISFTNSPIGSLKAKFDTHRVRYASRLSPNSPYQKAIIVPASWKTSSDLDKYLSDSLEQNDLQDAIIVKHDRPVQSRIPNLKQGNFKENKFDTYDIANSQSSNCNDMKKEFRVQASLTQKFDNATSIAETYLRQRKVDPALAEMDDFIKEDVEAQLRAKNVTKHWYKFAGSSVWLEDYGVHLMISRVMYSKFGVKRWYSIHLSMLYAQVFDENWNELENVNFVVENKLKDEKAQYRTMAFPQFLPVPFYHNANFQKDRYYGAEDPRVMLVKNEQGLMEPLVVYNSYHRKLKDKQEVQESTTKLEYQMFRLMFMAWPLRMQKGKTYVQGYEDYRYASNYYMKAVEIVIKDEERSEILKNWTPFTRSEPDLTHQTSIHFITRWDNLEIIKCPLQTDAGEGTTLCHYESKLSENPASEVGPFRGGTEMINLKDIDPDILLPDNKEAWVGFARAHVLDCGCGRKMYRPNLAVLISEDGKFKLSQLGAFTSFNVEVRGWGSGVVESQCGKRDANVLLPNGISAWYPGDGEFPDFMTLTVSVADDSVEIVHVRGILDSLLSSTSILEAETSSNTEALMHCCIEGSRDFCRLYGQEQLTLGHLDPTSPELPPKSGN